MCLMGYEVVAVRRSGRTDAGRDETHVEDGVRLEFFEKLKCKIRSDYIFAARAAPGASTVGISPAVYSTRSLSRLSIVD